MANLESFERIKIRRKTLMQCTDTVALIHLSQAYSAAKCSTRTGTDAWMDAVRGREANTKELFFFFFFL